MCRRSCVRHGFFVYVCMYVCMYVSIHPSINPKDIELPRGLHMHTPSPLPPPPHHTRPRAREGRKRRGWLLRGHACLHLSVAAGAQTPWQNDSRSSISPAGTGGRPLPPSCQRSLPWRRATGGKNGGGARGFLGPPLAGPTTQTVPVGWIPPLSLRLPFPSPRLRPLHGPLSPCPFGGWVGQGLLGGGCGRSDHHPSSWGAYES